MTKKHVVIDARESGTTTGRYVDKLIENLHELHPSYRVTLVAKAHRLEYLAAIAPKFSLQPTQVDEFTFSEQLTLKRELRQLQPDLVHFPMVQQPIFYKGKVVTTMNDLTTLRFGNPTKNAAAFWLKQRVYWWVNMRASRKSARIITYTDFVKNDIIRTFRADPDKFTTIYLAADSISEPPKPIPGLIGKTFIMYTGRPTPHKNLERLIEAFSLLQRNRPELVLVLAGKQDANYKRHEANVKKMGLNNVLFTGFVSDGQLRWLYENCSTYVFPSLSEGFGLPGLEAMTQGAPVASSNATCLPEVYGNAAHYFDPLNVNEMAQKIAEVMDDQALRSILITSGHKKVQKYSWRRTAEQTLAVYKQILGG